MTSPQASSSEEEEDVTGTSPQASSSSEEEKNEDKCTGKRPDTSHQVVGEKQNRKNNPAKKRDAGKRPDTSRQVVGEKQNRKNSPVKRGGYNSKKKTCEICKLEFSFPWLKRHMRERHKEEMKDQLQTCPKCGKAYFKLHAHMLQAHGPKKVNAYVEKRKIARQVRQTCDRCKRKISAALDMKRHMIGHEKDEACQTQSGQHVCDNCMNRYDDADKLAMHRILYCSTFGTETVCFKCKRSPPDLEKHLIGHDKDEARQTQFGPHVCGNCMKRYDNAPQLGRHRQYCSQVVEEEHNDEDNEVKETDSRIKDSKKTTSYRCSKHGIQFDTVDEYNSHKYSHHVWKTKRKPATCLKCGETFSEFGNLKKHNASFHMDKGEGVYKCHFCRKKFNDKILFRDHMKTHPRPVRTKCRFCHLMFINSLALKRHEKENHQYRLCQLCGKNMLYKIYYAHRKGCRQKHEVGKDKPEKSMKQTVGTNRRNQHLDADGVVEGIEQETSQTNNAQINVSGRELEQCLVSDADGQKEGIEQKSGPLDIEPTNIFQRYKCSKCSVMFEFKPNYEAHKQKCQRSTVSNEMETNGEQNMQRKREPCQIYTCEKCLDIFDRSINLTSHEAIHRWVECELCKGILPDEYTLQTHKLLECPGKFEIAFNIREEEGKAEPNRRYWTRKVGREKAKSCSDNQLGSVSQGQTSGSSASTVPDIVNNGQISGSSASAVPERVDTGQACSDDARKFKKNTKVNKYVYCCICSRPFEEADHLQMHELKHINHYKKEKKGHVYTKQSSEKADNVCSTCDVSFMSEKALQEHKILVALNKANYPVRCPYCFYSDKTPGHLVQSECDFLQHKKLFKFSCQFCSHHFKDMTALERHLNKTHDFEDKKQCPGCSQWFGAQRFQQHMEYMRKAVERLECKCFACGMVFDSVEKLDEHDATYKIRCRICLRHFWYEKSFKTHIKSKHNLGSMQNVKLDYKCKHCDQSFERMSELSAHLKQVILETEPTGSLWCSWEGRFKTCFSCGMAFQKQSDYDIHKSVWNFTCYYCHQHFRQPRMLYAHMKEHGHQDKVGVSCKLCNHKFDSVVEKRAHESRIHWQYRNDKHKKQDRFPCKLCGEVMPTVCQLDIHYQTEKCIKELETIDETCILCRARLLNSYEKSVHMKDHEAEGELRCDFCKKQFKSVSSQDFYKHETPRRKKSMCTVCNTSLVASCQIEVHERSCIKGKTCAYCLETIKDSSDHARYKRNGYQCTCCGLKAQARCMKETHEAAYRYICRDCKQHFKTFTEFLDHLTPTIWKGKEFLECSYCGEKVKNEDQRCEHESLFKFRCLICKKHFSTALEAIYHHQTNHWKKRTNTSMYIHNILKIYLMKAQCFKVETVKHKFAVRPKGVKYRVGSIKYSILPSTSTKTKADMLSESANPTQDREGIVFISPSTSTNTKEDMLSESARPTQDREGIISILPSTSTKTKDDMLSESADATQDKEGIASILPSTSTKTKEDMLSESADATQDREGIILEYEQLNLAREDAMSESKQPLHDTTSDATCTLQDISKNKPKLDDNVIGLLYICTRCNLSFEKLCEVENHECNVCCYCNRRFYGSDVAVRKKRHEEECSYFKRLSEEGTSTVGEGEDTDSCEGDSELHGTSQMKNVTLAIDGSENQEEAETEAVCTSIRNKDDDATVVMEASEKQLKAGDEAISIRKKGDNVTLAADASWVGDEAVSIRSKEDDVPTATDECEKQHEAGDEAVSIRRKENDVPTTTNASEKQLEVEDKAVSTRSNDDVATAVEDQEEAKTEAFCTSGKGDDVTLDTHPSESQHEVGNRAISIRREGKDVTEGSEKRHKSWGETTSIRKKEDDVAMAKDAGEKQHEVGDEAISIRGKGDDDINEKQHKAGNEATSIRNKEYDAVCDPSMEDNDRDREEDGESILKSGARSEVVNEETSTVETRWDDIDWDAIGRSSRKRKKVLRLGEEPEIKRKNVVNAKSNQCYCKRVFKSKDFCNEHQSKNSLEGIRCICVHCNVELKTKCHIKYHLSQYPHTCTGCKQHFNEPELLERHKKLCIKCNLCHDTYFQYEHQLRSHKVRHHLDWKEIKLVSDDEPDEQTDLEKKSVENEIDYKNCPQFIVAGGVDASTGITTVLNAVRALKPTMSNLPAMEEGPSVGITAGTDPIKVPKPTVSNLPEVEEDVVEISYQGKRLPLRVDAKEARAAIESMFNDTTEKDTTKKDAGAPALVLKENDPKLKHLVISMPNQVFTDTSTKLSKVGCILPAVPGLAEEQISTLQCLSKLPDGLVTFNLRPVGGHRKEPPSVPLIGVQHGGNSAPLRGISAQHVVNSAPFPSTSAPPKVNSAPLSGTSAQHVGNSAPLSGTNVPPKVHSVSLSSTSVQHVGNSVPTIIADTLSGKESFNTRYSSSYGLATQRGRNCSKITYSEKGIANTMNSCENGDKDSLQIFTATSKHHRQNEQKSLAESEVKTCSSTTTTDAADGAGPSIGIKTVPNAVRAPKLSTEEGGVEITYQGKRLPLRLDVKETRAAILSMLNGTTEKDTPKKDAIAKHLEQQQLVINVPKEAFAADTQLSKVRCFLQAVPGIATGPKTTLRCLSRLPATSNFRFCVPPVVDHRKGSPSVPLIGGQGEEYPSVRPVGDKGMTSTSEVPVGDKRNTSSSEHLVCGQRKGPPTLQFFGKQGKEPPGEQPASNQGKGPPSLQFFGGQRKEPTSEQKRESSHIVQPAGNQGMTKVYKQSDIKMEGITFVTGKSETSFEGRSGPNPKVTTTLDQQGKVSTSAGLSAGTAAGKAGVSISLPSAGGKERSQPVKYMISSSNGMVLLSVPPLADKEKSSTSVQPIDNQGRGYISTPPVDTGLPSGGAPLLGTSVPLVSTSTVLVGTSVPLVSNSVPLLHTSDSALLVCTSIPGTVGTNVPLVATSAPAIGTSVPPGCTNILPVGTGTTMPPVGSSVPHIGSSVPRAGTSIPHVGNSVPLVGTNVPLIDVSSVGNSVALAGTIEPPQGSSVPTVANIWSRKGSSSKYICSKCNRVFSRMSYLTVHMDAHTMDEACQNQYGYYQCDTCMKRYTDIERLAKHKSSFCLMTNNEKGSVVSRQSQNYQDNASKVSGPYSCSKCGRNYRTDHTLKCHMDGHVRDESRQTQSGQHICDDCMKRYDNVHDKAMHQMAYCFTTSKHICSQCKRVYSRTSDLIVHMNGHTRDAACQNQYGYYQCDTCMKRYSDTERLAVHKWSYCLTVTNNEDAVDSSFSKTYLGLPSRAPVPVDGPVPKILNTASTPVPAPDSDQGKTSTSEAAVGDQGKTSTSEAAVVDQGKASTSEALVGDQAKVSTSVASVSDQGKTCTSVAPVDDQGKASTREAPVDDQGKASTREAPVCDQGKTSIIIVAPVGDQGKTCIQNCTSVVPVSGQGKTSTSVVPVSDKGKSCTNVLPVADRYVPIVPRPPGIMEGGIAKTSLKKGSAFNPAVTSSLVQQGTGNMLSSSSSAQACDISTDGTDKLVSNAGDTSMIGISNEADDSTPVQFVTNDGKTALRIPLPENSIAEKTPLIPLQEHNKEVFSVIVVPKDGGHFCRSMKKDSYVLTLGQKQVISVDMKFNVLGHLTYSIVLADM